MSEATRRGQLETVAHPLTGAPADYDPLFAAVLHFDEMQAVEPLERTAAWERGEVPETFPTGL